MLRPRWFVRSPHCGLGKVRTETHHYQSKLELSLPAQRDSPHWLPEFVDDVEVITRGDGTGGVQQIGLAAVRGRPNALRARDAAAEGPENAGPRPCQTTEKALAADSIRIDVFDDSLD